MNKIKIAFICVHNSCRSQIAEALGKFILKDIAEVYSAGTEVKNRINQDAVRLMKAHHNIDMEETQRPKLITELPKMDYVITMGCNVSCPPMLCNKRTDWGLDDPSGKDDEQFMTTIKTIEEKLKKLKKEIIKENKGDFTMKNMEIYEPAMCCSTGLCGVGVNPELLRIAATLQNLKENGIEVKRYNLNSAPDAFMKNSEVSREINQSGTDSLPLISVDGKIVMKKKYPSNEEIASLLGISIELLTKKTTNHRDCCSKKDCC